ncbi:pyridine nucleotide-disulfide oxidoreductase [Paenibacillus sp. FSL R7-0273]|uniref:FAD-dependent oxidoreductase n=1 Tax=Paenibacillus sp. FSL R7-0273 TaxID=1536772 RepID=UPI0004F7ED65|nr:FAD-dependent oxidoreductase [Paenibacillus sp. FSL R7-0273]AIQ44914.1 pyridine nucleotide-disulfide oxidoreductase [Paenibacillus sp. FSL R7-0273]OMF93235.1 pyridine nucleotide-disulfide oxidoreductase [Paenibacillus sp. FSL R7-0273]
MYEVAVIGAGPAGASAALFTAKAGKKTLLIDNDKGMTRRGWYENYYGIAEIGGPDLVETGHKQAVKFGAELVAGQAVNLTAGSEGITVETEDGATYEAKHVILATGVLTDLAAKAGVETKDGTEPRIKTVVAVNAEGKTNVDRIWAAGTVAGVSVHAIITAGDGAKVAINIISELNGARYVDHDLLKA